LSGASLPSAHAQISDDRINDSVPGQMHAAEDISISATSFRFSRHNKKNADGYFTIENHSATAHLLDEITSPGCGHITAHHTEQETTSNTADLFSHLALPAHTAMAFSLGGYHLVCDDITPAFVSGAHLPVTFSFMGGTSRTVDFIVAARPSDEPAAPE